MKRLLNSSTRLLLVVFCGVTAVALISAGATTTAPFGAYNPDWDGATGLRSTADAVGADPTVVQNTSAVADYPPNETIVVVIAPDSSYSADSALGIANFVRAGGTLLVADDVAGPTNELLGALGARARVDGRLVQDERHHYRSPALPVANNVSEHALTTGVSKLTLNHGSPVRPNGATVLVSTSEYAYLDENRNDNLDEAESLDSRPVATVEEIGSGRVIVVGDPSIFINTMLERPGNRKFATNVFGRSSTVIFDHSHTAPIPPVVAALLAVRSSVLLQALIGGLGLTLIALWSARPPFITSLRNRVPGIRSRNGSDGVDFDIEATIKRAHPEWDDDRIRRVTQGVKSRHEKGDANDRTR